MPVPAHYLITWGGVFGSVAAPVERWQFSLKRTGIASTQNAFPTQDVLLTALTALQGSFQSRYLNKLQAGIRHTFTDIRFIGSDGKQPKDAAGAYAGARRLETDGPSGASGLPRYPYQVAVVTSLNTARSGPSGKGRFFLPAPDYPLSNDGRISATDAGGLASTAKDFLGEVNAVTIEAGAGPVSVMSSKGYASPVTSVRVGRVLDTHRSRRSDMLEGFSPNVVL